MKKAIVLNAVGSDRPGIVAAVSKVLYETGFNIEDSSMTLLKGEFAMILIISTGADISLNQLDERFNELRKKMQLLIYLHELSNEELQHIVDAKVKAYMISVYGVDKPGIVYKITQLLAEKKVNITDVNTTSIDGEKKDPIYIMVLEVEVYPNISEEQLRKDLQNLAKEMKVDINVSSIDTEEL